MKILSIIFLTIFIIFAGLNLLIIDNGHQTCLLSLFSTQECPSTNSPLAVINHQSHFFSALQNSNPLVFFTFFVIYIFFQKRTLILKETIQKVRILSQPYITILLLKLRSWLTLHFNKPDSKNLVCINN
ncbi:MAG: hypothetical protein COU06_02730 [Candidatus Harrisonbacteria bacterium CG10_big_fil_rev_8_21_14_0_10_38_8]|uniref:Transmembrane protein n=1 Tax=Candidatus Harrisonbacteria bacterium CG10_big_fil_rev_8_21_14_0_10_38_8 TaxID=1974582 RepID=A0A2M6WJK8_9BACT|nr:MAG: hypothetical protein COU06_02730 [Candidatus Harrisonbacteria bacterium CG10_big_fil_rev_8_21_14_0_10_38_8]